MAKDEEMNCSASLNKQNCQKKGEQNTAGGSK
jgi:hypothetical protein